jgi:hypothetical protein
VVVSKNELQVSIEQRLEELSEEAERLRAALDALDSVEMPGASTSLPRRAAPRAATRQAVLTAVADRHARCADDGACAVHHRPDAPADPGDVTVDTGERRQGVVMRSAGAAAGPAGSEESGLGTGADRAVQSLRRELAAGLRTNRL